MPQILFSCPEDILSQPKTATGHFCSSCSKNVVDFRKFSAEEIKQHFLNEPRNSCGIFNSNQVTSPLQSSISGLFRIAFALVFLLGMNSTDLRAQTNVDSVQVYPQTISVVQITGTVTDKFELLPFVKIAVYSNNQMIGFGMTDFDGKYVVKISGTYASSDLMILFQYPGFSELRVNLNPQNQETVYLSPQLMQSDNIIVGIWIDTENQVIIPYDPYDFGKTTIKGDDLRNRQR